MSGVLWLFLPAVCIAAEQPKWLVGPELHRTLDLPVSVTWSGQTLRAGLESFAAKSVAERRLAMMLDRRVDPERPLTLAINNVPLRQAIDQIADEQKLGAALLGPVVYFGPQDHVGELRTLAALTRDAVERLPRERRSVFLRPQPLAWEALATPREVLGKIEAASRVTIRGIERVPHDLWPAVELPPLALVDRIALVAAGFDLTLNIAADGKSIELVPIERPVRLVRDYQAGSRPEQVAEKLAAVIPDAEFKVARGKLYVRGRAEDHEKVVDALAGRPVKRKVATATQVYSLKIENQPVGPVVRELARRVGLSIKFDEAAIQAADVSLDAPISFEVEKATLDALLDAALKPAGLTYRRDGETIVVTPRKNAVD